MLFRSVQLLWLALLAAPAQLFAALWARLRGQKVRARRLVCEAASLSPGYYRWWSANCGSAQIANWCSDRIAVADQDSCVAVLILPGVPALEANTRASVLSALPDAVLLAPQATLRASLAKVEAEWLIVLRPGDSLAIGIAAVLARVLADRSADMVFWDHDVVSQTRYPDPVIKPEWDPLLASRHELLGPAAIMRMNAICSLLTENTGDVSLSVAAVGELQTRLAQSGQPCHIPLVLTHSCNADLWAEAGGLVPYAEPADWPGVSIIIPTRDHADLLANCLNSLDQLDYGGPVELLVIDNGSSQSEALRLFDALSQRPLTTVLRWPGAFNFAAMMNFAAAEAQFPFLCLLNNDVEARDGAWLKAMVRHARQPGVGAVGARLLYPDGCIQHVGVGIGIGGAAGHVAKGARPTDRQFALWHNATRRVSAVTAACLVIERSRYLAVGGMDAEAFAVDFNDVDLCLKLDRAGLENRVITEATLIHHESRTRGRDRSGKDLARFQGELMELRRRWNTQYAQDPWHSPQFSRQSERCLLRC